MEMNADFAKIALSLKLFRRDERSVVWRWLCTMYCVDTRSLPRDGGRESTPV